MARSTAPPRGVLEIPAGRGTIFDRKGVTFRGVRITVDGVLTEKDRHDLARWVVPRFLEGRIAFAALSFVRGPGDVRALRALAPGLPVVAKIETREAAEAAPAIIRESDGVMVARGDLGLQCEARDVPRLQKEIVRVGSGDTVTHERWTAVTIDGEIADGKFEWTPPEGWREWRRPQRAESRAEPGATSTAWLEKSGPLPIESATSAYSKSSSDRSPASRIRTSQFRTRAATGNSRAHSVAIETDSS